MIVPSGFAPNIIIPQQTFLGYDLAEDFRRAVAVVSAPSFLSVVPKSEHKGAWKTQFALEVSVVVISRPAGRSSFRPKVQIRR